VTKTDFKKTLPSYKAKQGRFELIELPTLRYLMIEGKNGPASQDYLDAIQALYPVAYKLKFMSKLDLENDYVVPPLQAQWWADDMRTFTTHFDKSAWRWNAMLLTPEWITPEMFSAAVDTVAAKNAPVALSKLRLEALEEGLCVQTLHVGSYDNEGPTLKEIHETFIPDQGLRMRGRHHEIYFNDFRKTAPEKLRTLLRQPVETKT